MAGQTSTNPWEKKRFQLWSIKKESPTTTRILQYGKGNDNKIMIRVVHGGNFTVFPEHNSKNVPMNFPHYLMNSPSKRIENVIHLLVIEHPRATVDDEIAYIKQMLNMTIPRENIEDVMDMAKENVVSWKML
ncbi:unnamed protein product [Lactuca virosa]|uniref:Uncharacterized protein n=1 Tax=Lactuca virosa TaxID=75947 RepID=A0AAU9MP88_9ASTR|nr:unnamed protein product [Lactuca virosa]